MSSDGECGELELRVPWFDLLSVPHLLSDPIVLGGLCWRLCLEQVNGGLRCKVGFEQLEDDLVSCPVHVRTVLDSCDPDGMRWQDVLGVISVCTSAKHTAFCSNFPPNAVEQCLNNDKVAVTVFLQVYEPSKFIPISLTSSLWFFPPAPCLYPLGECQGLVYTLNRSAQVSPTDERWSILCHKPFQPGRSTTMAELQIHVPGYVGAVLTKTGCRIALTQVNRQHNRLELHILNMRDFALTTRHYNIPATDQDLEWSRAVLRKAGWITISSGCRDGHPMTVCFRFWLLREDKMELLTELHAPTVLHRTEPATIDQETLFCIVTAPSWRKWIYVCDLSHPEVWQPYEICPRPAFYCHALFHNKGQLVLATQTWPGPRYLLFKLELDPHTIDCTLTPFVSLPEGVDHFRIGTKSLVALQEQRITIIHVQPASLKTLATLALIRLFGQLSNKDDRNTWMQWLQDWKRKLGTMIGNGCERFI